MQHSIPVEKYGPLGAGMAQAVEKCVHCGFCLPTCPTYVLLGEEMNSPRGRIVLMKSVLEGELALEEALPYVDACLGCLGCVTVCPSGVQYGELVAPFRSFAAGERQRPLAEQAARRLALSTLPDAGRFRVAAQAGRLARPLRGALPERLRAMLDLLPGELPAAQPLPGVYPAQGKRRARVALLAGCVQQALAPEINWATLRVLSRNGVEVVIPEEQGCCGALDLHAGEWRAAQVKARRNLAAFPADVDAILTNAAGCGSGMKEYPLLFKETPLEERAGAFADLVQDVSVFLDRLGLLPPPPLPEPMRLAYHDACHLLHAQKVSAEPRRLLSQVPNLTLVAIPEGEICCGSAGIYNIEQPEIARQLGERKARFVLESGAQALAAGNIGCLVQLQRHLRELGHTLPAWHTMEVLDGAYAGK